MKKISIVLGLLILGIIGWLLVRRSTEQPTAVPSTAPTRQAPAFALQDYTGKTVRSTDFPGKPLVINSWAAWCPFCRKELVDFAAAQKEFGDRVVFVAIDRAESREVAKKYSDELGVTGDLIFLLDSSDSFYRSIEGFSMPETIFVDKDGSIIIHKRGPMDLDEIRQKIREIL